MLSRLLFPPAPVRSLVFSSAPTRRFSSASDPLRILFCGSDRFSIASLRALDEARREDASGLIASIDVVHRPAKPTGRGLKVLREVPIKHVAQELKLDTHVVDAFTGWTPPVPFNLVVAVSFGLFVPPRILSSAKYGGLNVHPSLLPDLRGPGPIEHAILKGRKYTGVSIQTLHPKHFDRGIILAQTPAPGIPIHKDMDATSLQHHLATHGAEMLVDVLRSGAYVQPHKDVGWYADSSGPISHAPKIIKQDHFIDFHKSTLDEILAIQSALGDPWCILPNGHRLIIHKVAYANVLDALIREPGIWIDPAHPLPLFRAACGSVGEIVSCTYAGLKAGHGKEKLMHLFASR